MSENNRDEVEDSYNGPDGRSLAWVVALIFAIFTPLTVLGAVGTYLAFAWQRIRMSAIFWFALVPSLLLLLVFFEPAIRFFTLSWSETIPGIVDGSIELLPGILTVFAQQALPALPFGIGIGLAYSAYRWKTRPEWIETKFRLTPFEIWRKRRNIKDIKSDKNSPRDGMTLGIDENGNRIVQTYDESRAHTIIFGASGSGKTTTLKSRLRDAIKDGQGAIIIDLKGGRDVPEEIALLANRYNRKFTHWLFQPRGVPYDGPAVDGPAYYDPLARGEATRRKDLLIESRNWSEEYYKQEASNYIQMLFNVLIANPEKDISTLSQVVRLLDPKYLQERAIPLGSNKDYFEIVRSIDSLNDEKISAGKKSAIEGLRSQLEVLLHSVAGPYLQLDPDNHNNIDLKKAAHEGQIIVFSLDSSNYGHLASLVANLIIQDLKTVSSELRQDPADKPLQVVVDEFSAVGSTSIIGLINKSRDANMPVTLTTQALGDLKNESQAFLDQLIGIVGSFIIHRPNKLDDAEVFAGLTGKVVRKKFSEAVVYSTGFLKKGSAAGSGNMQDVEEYTYKPDSIQRLKMGEMIYVNKSQSPMKVIKVLCIPEDPSMVQGGFEETAKKFEDIEGTKNNSQVNEKNSNNSDEKEYVQPPKNNFQPPVNINPLTVPVSPGGIPHVESNDDSSETKEPNMERLNEIFNQSPDVLLPRKTERKDEFEVKRLPPIVSPPLKPLPSIDSKTTLPPLPVLPKPPVINKPVAEADKTNSSDKPIVNPEVKKDEFDF